MTNNEDIFDLFKIKLIDSQIIEDLKKQIRDDASDIIFDNGKGKKFRIIAVDYIDEIMCTELAKEPEKMAHFDTQFLSDTLEWPQVAIELLKSHNLYEQLGTSIINFDRLSELQEQYVSIYGYGEYFGAPKSKVEQIEIEGYQFYVFELD